MKEYLTGSISGYLEKLAERSITPGGGSASALTAAVGAALNLMVLNYSMKKDSPDEAPSGFLDALKKEKQALKNLSDLIDEDCRAFEKLMKALSAKEDAQKEYRGAAGVPMEVCRQSKASLEVTALLAPKANKNLMTDVGCASHMLKAAFLSARLNAEVNLKRIEDGSFRDSSRRALSDMEKEVEDLDRSIQETLKIS